MLIWPSHFDTVHTALNLSSRIQSQVASLASFENQPRSPSRAFVRTGFDWKAADAYLFDIDGTLLNSRDAVHYFAFHHAVQQVFGCPVKIEGIPVHGNTDMGILRAVLRREGFSDGEIDARLPQMVAQMCAEVDHNAADLRPELCPSIKELVSWLQSQGKLLGAASGNLETIGWLKLERAGLKELFSLGSFCYPRERRADIFRHGINLARNKLGQAAQVYVVGDTPADIEAAREAQAPVIVVATGIYEFEHLVDLKPDACFGCGTDMLQPGTIYS